MKLKDEILLAIKDVYEIITFKKYSISLECLYLALVFGSVMTCMLSIVEIVYFIVYFDIFGIIIYIIIAIISAISTAFFIRRFDNEI